MSTESQIKTFKLPHDGRDREIYEHIRASGKNGLTRQELVVISGYEINQTSSAVANLKSSGAIREQGKRIGATGHDNGIVVLADGTQPLAKSRRGELKRLRETNKKCIALLRKYVEKYGQIC